MRHAPRHAASCVAACGRVGSMPPCDHPPHQIPSFLLGAQRAEPPPLGHRSEGAMATACCSLRQRHSAAWPKSPIPPPLTVQAVGRSRRSPIRPAAQELAGTQHTDSRGARQLRRCCLWRRQPALQQRLHLLALRAAGRCARSGCRWRAARRHLRSGELCLDLRGQLPAGHEASNHLHALPCDASQPTQLWAFNGTGGTIQSAAAAQT